MATSFKVVSLGKLSDMDTQEGNYSAENADALTGQSFGGDSSGLLDRFVDFSPGSQSASAGRFETAYDQNGSAKETFKINGGDEQVFDSVAVFDATITYFDGSTATVTAVIFQDTGGNTYWAPEMTDNADQAAMEAGPIQSLTLDELLVSRAAGLASERSDWKHAVCYVAGAQVETDTGARPVEALKPGDFVRTRDQGVMPVRWVGRSVVQVTPATAPIRIDPCALGPGVPSRPLWVSPQHRVLLRSEVAERICGKAEVLVAAKKLLALPGVVQVFDLSKVTYVHFMLDSHELVFANGAVSESMYLGRQARVALGQSALREIAQFFPDLVEDLPDTDHLIPSPEVQSQIVGRIARHHKLAFER